MFTLDVRDRRTVKQQLRPANEGASDDNDNSIHLEALHRKELSRASYPLSHQSIDMDNGYWRDASRSVSTKPIK